MAGETPLSDDQWISLGCKRMNWGHRHLDKIWPEGNASSLEFYPSVAIVENSLGGNVFHQFLIQNFRAARGSLSAAQHILSDCKSEIELVGVQGLLRQSLMATVKPLYLLQPTKTHKQEKRAEQLFENDQGSYRRACNAELRHVGKGDEVTEDISFKKLDETSIIKNSIQFLKDKHAPCDDPGCPYQDLDGLSHRLLRLWLLYGSVVHGNLWHMAQDLNDVTGETASIPTELPIAMADLGWLYAHTVMTYLERYDLSQEVETMEVHWDHI